MTPKGDPRFKKSTCKVFRGDLFAFSLFPSGFSGCFHHVMTQTAFARGSLYHQTKIDLPKLRSLFQKPSPLKQFSQILGLSVSKKNYGQTYQGCPQSEPNFTKREISLRASQKHKREAPARPGNALKRTFKNFAGAPPRTPFLLPSFLCRGGSLRRRGVHGPTNFSEITFFS